MDTPLQTLRILCQFWFKKKPSKQCCPLVQTREGASLCCASLPPSSTLLYCRCLKQGDTLLLTRRPIPERAHCTHANTPQPQGESLKIEILVPRFPIRDPRPPTLRQTHTALRLPLRLYWLFIGQWLPLSCPVPSSPLSPPSGALHVPLSPPMH